MKSLLAEAWRLEPFVPPFMFSAFFSPEDTLLCVCAADSARNVLGGERGVSIVELTAGSGLVGLYLLRDGGWGMRDGGGERREAAGWRHRGKREAGSGSTLLGLDVDGEAAVISAQNAKSLGLDNRARFVRSDLWSVDTLELLRVERPQLLICNPPYVPEPPGKTMQIEAGAGPHGTAHLLRALELTRELQPDTLALSWCSLSDPVGIISAAHGAGYDLVDLFVTAIADGEYSGSVHDYLRNLDDCYINEQPETLAVIASDGAARFAYLLISGAFVKRDRGWGMRDERAPTGDAVPPSPIPHPPSLLKRLCEDFQRDGIPALASRRDRDAHCYILNRWDELQLRVMLHGLPERSALSTR